MNNVLSLAAFKKGVLSYFIPRPLDSLYCMASVTPMWSVVAASFVLVFFLHPSYTGFVQKIDHLEVIECYNSPFEARKLVHASMNFQN